MKKNEIIFHIVIWILINVGLYFYWDAFFITNIITTALGYVFGLITIAYIKSWK